MLDIHLFYSFLHCMYIFVIWINAPIGNQVEFSFRVPPFELLANNVHSYFINEWFRPT